MLAILNDTITTVLSPFELKSFDEGAIRLPELLFTARLILNKHHSKAALGFYQ